MRSAADAQGMHTQRDRMHPAGRYATGIRSKTRSFRGDTVFLTTLGGRSAGSASAIAVTPSGEVLVSGTSSNSGFPSTAGAYSVANTANHPWLLKLNATGAQVVFSATGIGGSAVALDAAGDIFVAGTTIQLDYPTTAGTYQPSIPRFYACAGFLLPRWAHRE